MKKLYYLFTMSFAFLLVQSCSSPNEETIAINPSILNKILFSKTQQNGNNVDIQLHVMNVDGSNDIQITNFNNGTVFNYNGEASWSPDGSRIIFVSDKDNVSGIYTMNPDGSNVVRINNSSNGGSEPKFSPNGTKILFSKTQQNGNNVDIQLHVMNVDGSNDIQITNFNNGTSFNFNGEASWSPDGSRIIFVSNKDDVSGIYTMNPDGSNVVRINNSSNGGSDPSWK